MEETVTQESGAPVEQPGYTTGTLDIAVAVSPAVSTPDMSYSLTITASNGVHIDNEIFVYQLVPSVPGEPEGEYQFVTVANSVSMAEYPKTTVTTEEPVYCRKSSITLLFSSMNDLDTAAGSILGRIRRLLEETEAQATLNPPTMYHFSFKTDNED